MNFQEIFAILQSGGWVMIMLAVLALILYVTAFDLAHYVYSGNLGGKMNSWLSWIRDPSQGKGQVGEIIRYTQGGDADAKRIQQRFEQVRYETSSHVSHRLVMLNTLVAAAPLAGLLGTVIGMLGTFSGLAAGGSESMSLVAGGIHEALLTTQTGLMIALPGVFASLMIKRRQQKLEESIARLESMTLIHKIGFDSLIEDEDEVATPEPAREVPTPAPARDAILVGDDAGMQLA